jgi:hypothetical protein
MASVLLSIWSRKQVKDESPFSMNPITLKRRRRRTLARLPIFLFNAKNKTIDIQPHLFENETEIFVKLIKKNDYRRIVVRQMSFSKLLKKFNEQASLQMN